MPKMRNVTQTTRLADHVYPRFRHSPPEAIMRNRISFLGSILALCMWSAVVGAQSLAVYHNVNGGALKAGEQVLQTVMVRNEGSVSVSQVNLEVRIPPTSSTHRLTGGGACSGGCGSGDLAVWSFGSLAPDESRVVAVSSLLTSSAVPGSTITLDSVASSANASSAAGNAEAYIAGDDAPLRLHISADNSIAREGEDLTITIYFANGSTSLADPVAGEAVLTAGIPEGTTVIDADGAAITGGDMRWSLGSLAPTASGVRVVVVRVNESLAGQGVVAGASLSDNSGRVASGRVVVPVGTSAGLQVTLAPGPSPVLLGEQVWQWITVKNTLGVAVNGVQLEAFTPDTNNAVHRVFANGSCSGGCSSVDRVSWNFGTIGPGQSRIAAVASSTSSKASGGRALPLAAVVSDAGGSRSYAQGYTVGGFLDVAPLRLDAMAEQERVSAGEVVTFVLAYGNASAGPADPIAGSAMLKATIPRGCQLLDAGGGNVVGRTVSWAVGQILDQASGFKRFSVRVNVPFDASSVRTDALIYDSAGRLASSNAVVAIEEDEDPIEVVVAASSNPVLVGEPITQWITVRNLGATPVFDSSLEVLAPDTGNAVVRVTGDGTCSGGCSAMRQARWSFGEIPPGQTRTVAMLSGTSSTIGLGRPLQLTALATGAGVSSSMSRRSVTSGMDEASPIRLGALVAKSGAGDSREVQFRLIFANPGARAGDRPVGNGLLFATVPEGSELVEADGAVLTNDGMLTWVVGHVPSGTHGVREFTVRIAASSSSRHAVSSAFYVESNGRLASFRSEVNLDDSDGLDIEQNASSPFVSPGSELVQSARVANASGTAISNVALQMFHPNFTTSGAILSGGGVCSGGCSPSRIATWSLGSLIPAQEVLTTMGTMITQSAPTGGLIWLTTNATGADQSSMISYSPVLIGTQFFSSGPLPPVVRDQALFRNGFE